MKTVVISSKCRVCGQPATGQLTQEDFLTDVTGKWENAGMAHVELYCVVNSNRHHPQARQGYASITWQEFQAADSEIAV